MITTEDLYRMHNFKLCSVDIAIAVSDLTTHEYLCSDVATHKYDYL